MGRLYPPERAALASVALVPFDSTWHEPMPWEPPPYDPATDMAAMLFMRGRDLDCELKRDTDLCDSLFRGICVGPIQTNEGPVSDIFLA